MNGFEIRGVAMSMIFPQVMEYESVEKWLKAFIVANADKSFFNVSFIARKAKIPKSLIPDVLSGRRDLNLKQLSKISDGLNLPLEVRMQLLILLLTQHQEYRGFHDVATKVNSTG